MKCVGGNKQRRSGPFIAVAVRVEVARRRTPGFSLRMCVRSQATLIYVVAIVWLLYRTTTLVVQNSENTYIQILKNKNSIIPHDSSPELIKG